MYFKLANLSDINKANKIDKLSFNKNGNETKTKESIIPLPDKILYCKIPSICNDVKAIAHNSILFVFFSAFFALAQKKTNGMNPSKKPPVNPNTAIKPKLPLANTGIPIMPKNKYIKIVFILLFSVRVNPINAIENVCNVIGTPPGNGIDICAVTDKNNADIK